MAGRPGGLLRWPLHLARLIFIAVSLPPGDFLAGIQLTVAIPKPK
jgi:hypothetical protein